MHELTDQELYEAIEYARNIDEDTGRSIVEKFQVEQAALAQTIFNIFPLSDSATKSGYGNDIYGVMF
jgi:hypothetical protein